MPNRIAECKLSRFAWFSIRMISVVVRCPASPLVEPEEPVAFRKPQTSDWSYKDGNYAPWKGSTGWLLRTLEGRWRLRHSQSLYGRRIPKNVKLKSRSSYFQSCMPKYRAYRRMLYFAVAPALRVFKLLRTGCGFLRFRKPCNFPFQLAANVACTHGSGSCSRIWKLPGYVKQRWNFFIYCLSMSYWSVARLNL